MEWKKAWWDKWFEMDILIGYQKGGKESMIRKYAK